MATSSLYDDCLLRAKILETHSYDGMKLDTKSVLALIENNLNPTQGATDEAIPDKLLCILEKISCEMKCKCSEGDHSHASAMKILKLLGNYSWESKIVLVLASLVLKNSQFSFVTKFDKSNPLISYEKKLKFEAIFGLVKASTEMAKSISKFKDFPSGFDAEPMQAALAEIQFAAYWIARIFVFCASLLTEILGHTQLISSCTEILDLPTLEQKMSSIRAKFNTQYDLCNKYMDEKKQIEYVEKLKLMMDKSSIHVDNQQVLQLLISTKDGSLPLEFGPDKTRKVGVDALKGKTVLLFISDFDISHEISALRKIYLDSRENTELQYEIVWLLIVGKIERDEEFEQRFVELKVKMPWYTAKNPVEPAVARYLMEEWRFSKKPVLVALNPMGKVVNAEAFCMVWAWGNAAYPFTLSREIEIWDKQEWSLHLLVDGIHQTLEKWIQEDKFICLYGGKNYEWIQEFVTKTTQVANAAGIQLGMVYMGKNTSQDRVKQLTQILAGRSLCWEDPAYTWHFWKRINSIVNSKIHHDANVENVKEIGKNLILDELLNMLMLGESKQGWALISLGAGSGPCKMARAKGNVVLKALVEFETWRSEAKHKGFMKALTDYLAGRRARKHCSQFYVVEIGENAPEMVICEECSHPMNKYRCYKDGGINN